MIAWCSWEARKKWPMVKWKKYKNGTKIERKTSFLTKFGGDGGFWIGIEQRKGGSAKDWNLM